MAKSREFSMHEKAHQRRRKEERLLPRARQEPADSAVEELQRLARIPLENPDPVFRVSAEHVLLYSNPAGDQLCRGWGCRQGRKVPEIIRTIVSAALAEGAVAQREITFDSRIYWLTVAPVVADGYVNIYAREITEHKRIEEARRQAEQRFKTIFDTTSDGIFLHDLETLKLTMGNQSCLQLLGYTQEEFLNLSVSDLHPQTDLPFIHAQIEAFLKGGQPTRRDIRFQRKDGSILYADVSSDLVRLDGKQYILVALKDITARKQAEEALAASEKKYRSLVENIPDVTWTTDRAGHTLFISPNVLGVYGYSAEEICTGGDTWLENVHPDDRPQMEAAFHALFTQKKPYDVEYRMRRKDGTWIWLHDRSVASYQKNGQWYADGVFSDITERKRMEEELRRYAEHLEELVETRTAELRESERRYRSLAENAPDVILRFDRELRHLYVNAAFGRVTGLPPDAVIGKTDRELGLPENLIPVWEQAVRTVFQTGRDQIIGFEMPTPRGRRHFEAHLVPEFAADGSTEHVLVITRDITERKRAEDALRFTQFAVDHTADAAFWMTEDARFFYVNEAACRALGYAREELLQMTVYDIDPAFTESVWRESWRRLKAQKSIILETVHRAKDGRVYPVEIRANYLEFDGRAYDCAFARDITERKRAEEALRQSEERHRRLLENLKGSHFIYVHDTQGIFQYLSESLTDVLGYTPGEFTAHYSRFMTDHPANQAVHRHTDLSIQGIRQPPYEVNMWHKDGSTRWLEVQEVPVFDARGQVIAVEGVAQDITERKRAEEALHRLNEQLEQQVAQRTEDLRRTVGQLRQLTLELSQTEDRERQRIADILHDDVQQTLAAAKFHLNLLGRAPRSAEEAQKIIEQVKQMLKDAIEKSRSLSHELSPALYQVDLTAVLEWLAHHMQQKHGLHVRVEAHGSVDSSSEPMRALLYKVARELLFNVAKHAGVNEARVCVRRMGPCFYLSVTDQGRGFDPEKLAGTAGFGLLSIRERIRLLGGRMRIRSAPGRGSRFLVAIPDPGTSPDAVPAAYCNGRTTPAEVRGD